ncbi:MAG: fibronectin type III-like domain-contianing protein [Clostridia bacterium]|nr:fibronectin type III-like domain-contianing protein [Clostridia bacterium]
MTVQVQLTNTGDIPGTETVQVYVHDVVSSVMQPVKRLVKFAKVTLAAGETKTVSLPLTMEDFSLVNAACQRVVEPGLFEIMAGHSSKDEDLLKTEVEW